MAFEKFHFCMLKVKVLQGESSTFRSSKFNFRKASKKPQNVKTCVSAGWKIAKICAFSPVRCVSLKNTEK